MAAANSSPTGIRHIPAPNSAERGLTRLAISGKFVHIERFGNLSSTELVVFIHGLGGSTNFYRPTVMASKVDDRQLLLYDLEGHGLSPTIADSVVSIASYTADLRDLILTLGLQRSRISFVAHSLGCLIALSYHAGFSGGAVFNWFALISLPPVQPSATAVERLYELAETIRAHGILSVVDDLVVESTSPQTRANNPLAVAYIRTIIANTSPEGYAKGCTALAAARRGLMVGIAAQVYMGAEDTITPPDDRPGQIYVKLKGVGNWCVLEEVLGSQGWLALELA